MTRIRPSTTVDAALLEQARNRRSGTTDAALVDEALAVLLARYRSAEVDASYAAYDDVSRRVLAHDHESVRWRAGRALTPR